MLMEVASAAASVLMDSLMDAKAKFAGLAGSSAPSVQEMPGANTSMSNIGPTSKKQGTKRLIEEVSTSSQGESFAGPLDDSNTARSRVDEPVSKKPRATQNEEGSTIQKLLVNSYLIRHARVRAEHCKHPLVYKADPVITQEFRTIILKMMKCESQLVNSRMKELRHVENELQDLESKKDSNNPDIKARIRSACRFIDAQALELLDGPILFKLFYSVNSFLRQRLDELDLPLTEIKEFATDLRKGRMDTLKLYKATKEEAEVKIVEILRYFNPKGSNQELEALSYNDMEYRIAHDRMLDTLTTITENCNATLAHGFDQMASTVEKVTRNVHAQAALLHTSQKSATTHVLSTVQLDSREGLSQTQQADHQAAEDQVNHAIAVNTAAQTKAHEKSVEISADQWQREEARRKKFLVDFQAYDIVIQQLRTYREGGPPPNPAYIKELGMPEVKACVHRLKHLWTKHSRAIKAHDVEQIRTDVNIYIEIATCLRETHYILHMLLYYNCCYTDVADAGWSLENMRELQAEMVQWAHEEPLKYTKPDVDAICQALQDVHDQDARDKALKPQPKVPSVSKKRNHFPRVYMQVPLVNQSTVPLTTGIQPVLNTQSGVAFQHVTSQAAAQTPPLPSILESDGTDSDDEEMDIDLYKHVCPQFQHGKGCSLVEDPEYPCEHDHPYVLKYNGPCPYLRQELQCPFGEVGCRYVHNHVIGPDQEPQAIQPAAAQASASNSVLSPHAKVLELVTKGMIAANEAQHYILAQNGNPVDSRQTGNYCRNWANNKCKNNKCPRIHGQQPGNQQASGTPNSQSNFSQHNPFQGGGQAPQPPTACSFFTNGNCRNGNNCSYSHDPQVVYQTFGYYPRGHSPQNGDAQMGDAALSGDNNNARRQPDHNQPCKNEQRGPCLSKKCRYTHSNPQSTRYRPGQQAQQQGKQGGRGNAQRAPYNHTYNPQQPIQFAPPQTTQGVQNWANRVAQEPPNEGPICYTCQQPGHKSNKCPQKGTSGNNSAVGNDFKGTCHVCGITGHVARVCPQKAANQGGGNRGGYAPSTTTFL